ncbi:cation:proton antiporter [Lactiplantibacillus paraplantarum]|mgnify:CR=1 FL=1|uniref:Na+/H+ antiporter n=2 Tax=Lactiplantibacillus paraplantarum TaxID=60520 RepID=A0AAD0X722_9LACO|nr:sodium:proton antiporter [Lactiplantibacillus paraplantarum]AVW09682.1 sodium:proton antiporter [Lactiplantibacillus paraplantarum]AYJ37895.1 sodium:proton antiporter [Lactiplantibacillus paraplantarum]ERL45071.1 putative Na(+)/H(+) antiporter [Lactiplantibacillus paraplantarum]KRL49454.1 na(+) h(+) antiporter [Lactiplantibacillus paraplantarum DSM 10667]MCU4682851.1 cation:proton antiporter [Lactiplantibacillus paraplantarum]
MPIIELVILLACLVLLSNVLSHYLVAIPVSLIQVGLGLVVALLLNVQVKLQTDWFMLVFIAPMLYNDGREFPKQELWELRGAIFANAIVLVFITTILGGFLIHVLIPTIPLAVGIALAAILSPTDPIAVQSISEGVKLPKEILHLVSGESLINDASGLIGFKYALAAAVTGTFVLGQAIGDFFYISLVGLAVGLALITIIQLIRDILRREGINDIVFNVVLQILTPFAIYFIAEEWFHASGVVAVVAAGVLSHLQNSHESEDAPELRLVTERVWNVVVYLLNGIVFLILGIELPVATQATIKGAHTNTFHAVFDVLIVWGILLLIRVAWTYAYMLFNWLRHHKKVKPSLRIAALSGLSGVRGAITMAGVFTIPTVIATGEAFPERSLVLFIAAGVIIVSLIAAAAILPLMAAKSLPFVTRGSSPDEDDAVLADGPDEVGETDVTDNQTQQLTYKQARIYILQLAIQNIEEHRRPENQRAAYDLILDQQFQMRRLEVASQTADELAPMLTDELQLRLVALNGERAAVRELMANKQTTKLAGQVYLRRVDRREQRFLQATHKPGLPTLRSLRLLIARAMQGIRLWLAPGDSDALRAALLDIQREASKAAIKALSQYLKQANVDEQQFDRQALYHLIVHYRNRIENAKNDHTLSRDDYEQQLHGLRIKSLGAERAGVQHLLESGQISLRTAAKLRQFINYSENLLMLNDIEADDD